MAGKIYTFCLPDIGEGVVEGEVIEWLKQEGDAVTQDEPVVVVMTDKATVELPSPYPGKILKQYYKPGQIAFKDKPLYDIELDPSVVAHTEKERPAPEVTRKLKAAITKDVESYPQHPSTGEALALPKVRRMANEWGIDIGSVTGTGKDGRVTEEDLHKAEAKKTATIPRVQHEGDEEHPIIGVRGLMARRMDQTRIPQFSYFEQVDATRLIEMRKKFMDKAAKEGIKLSFMPFLIRALSLVMQKQPLINASVDMQAGKVIIHKVQNIGVAMATAQGLIVPVLKGVEKMGLNDIIRGYEQLKIKAQDGKLASADMKDATITISNFGVLGGEGLWATPMVSDPEVAIMAVARIRETPVVKNGEVVVRSLLPLSWSFDHRIIDGELAASVSYRYCSLIRDPASLL